MTSHTGTILKSSLLLLLPVPTLPDGVEADYSVGVLTSQSTARAGDKTAILPVQPVDTKTGNLLPDFYDLWYNHVHILPNRIDTGNLTSEQIRVIEIFNGFFEQRTIESIAATDLSGVLLDIDTPLDIAPLGSLFANLVIDTVGSPQFNGFFTLTFDNKDYLLYVSGKRVLVIPFKHDWSVLPVERLAWLNSTSGKSLDGIEQLIMLRNDPRRTIQYSFLLATTQNNSAYVRSLFIALMAGWQTRVFAVPIWSDATRLKVQADAGQDVININTTYLDYDIGSYIMLWSGVDSYELVEIAEIHDTYIKATVNLVNTWQIGKTIVLPARLAYINNNLQGTKQTVDLDVVPVTFEFLQQYSNVNRIIYGSEVTYRNYPVLLTKGNYDTNVNFTIEQPVIRNDADTGIFSIEADQPAPDAGNDFAVILNGRESISTFLGWLDNRKGRLVPFWQPTWSKDMAVQQDIASAATSLLIKYIGYSSLYIIDGLPAFNRQDIMIRLKNGTRFFRRITGATPNSNGTETIGISSALGQTVQVSDIDRISFLIPSALKADTIELTWQNANVVTCNMQITDIYDDTI
jgi:hypothetical protein